MHSLFELLYTVSIVPQEVKLIRYALPRSCSGENGLMCGACDRRHDVWQIGLIGGTHKCLLTFGYETCKHSR